VSPAEAAAVAGAGAAVLAKGECEHMTLLELLSAMTSAAIFGGAVAPAIHAKAGIGGYALAIIIGSSLALCNAWMFYKLGGVLADLTSSYSETRQEWYGLVFCLFGLLWLLVGAVLTSLVTSVLMHLVT